jgi:predicted ATPase
VLHYLATNPGRVIAREELVKSVWRHSHVSAGVLRGYIRDLRDVLGDDAAAPQFIETIGRRGYRFIALPSVTDAAIGDQRSPIVGREAELRQLHAWWEQASQGERQVVFVTGEAGIGKTSLLDTFLDQVATDYDVWIGRGQCVEHYGAGEAYLPVLEALSQLGRGSGREHLTELLRGYAPTWLMHLPALLSPAEREGLQREVLGTTRERNLRELAEGLEALTRMTARAPPVLVLVLEDLQWSDHATLDFVASLARRRESARLLLIGTFRFGDAIVSGHPLKGLKQDLQIHGQCAELPLGLLSEEATADYLAARFAAGTRSPLRELARMLHARTDGNPLFMVNVVDDLVSQGVIEARSGRWDLRTAPKEIESRIPESLRQMIEQQVDRLTVADQRVVEAGSVAGLEFAAATVAGALDTDVIEVEERCSGLVSRGQLLRACGDGTLPNGTVTARYEFLHALHRRVVYDRLSHGRHQRLHRRLGEEVERVYGAEVGELAAALAVHFERGRDTRRAVQYRLQAAKNAIRRCANQEAIAHLTKGLELAEAHQGSDTAADVQEAEALLEELKS